MTAPAVSSSSLRDTLTGALEDFITAGWQAYRRAACIDWPDSGRRDICRAQVDLWTALEMHGRMEGGYPASLARYEREAAEARERLIETVRVHCGNRDAGYVSGKGKTRRGSIVAAPSDEGESHA
jgi:hypothetical protein